MLSAVIEQSKISKKTEFIGAAVSPVEYERLHLIARETGLNASALIREGLKLIDQEFSTLQRGQ